jgi:hypothetical protein
VGRWRHALADEAHVDVPDLDLVLPHNIAGRDDEAHDIAAQATAAWKAAVGGRRPHRCGMPNSLLMNNLWAVRPLDK